MPNILITGGTGTIGKQLTRLFLQKDYSVTVLTRHPEKYNSYHPNLSYAAWNVHEGFINEEAIEEADYIIHLAGANLAEKKWSEKRKIEIVESRVQSSDLLVHALKTYKHNVKVVVSASAIGWYGADTSAYSLFREDDLPEKDFLGETCRLWEESIAPIEDLGIRLVKLRTGIVISNHGGAFLEFKKALRFGLATVLGTGEQVISWIHEDDICNIYLFALQHSISGVFNAVAPYPVSNKKFVLTLAKKMRKNFFVPVYIPALMLKLILGEMSKEALKSTRVSSKKIVEKGFEFSFPTIEKAIDSLM